MTRPVIDGSSFRLLLLIVRRLAGPGRILASPDRGESHAPATTGIPSEL